jgi:glycosyltransferase involved in cell wall biosynthesis
MEKICIIQDELIPGGKTNVLLNIIKILNNRGIVPDLYSYDILSTKKASSLLGHTVQYHLGKVFDLGIKRFTYYKNYFLFPLIKHKLADYGLVINSGNCLHSMKDDLAQKTINYIFYLYPLEYCEPDYFDISLLRKLYLQPLRLMNRDFSNNEGSKYGLTIALSNFCKEKIEEFYYPLKNKIHVVYPPINIKAFWDEKKNRANQVISSGIFNPLKDQMSQIKIAEAFPHIKFFITGFISNKSEKKYYNECLSYIAKHDITNVGLIPNISHPYFKKLLKKSKYFIHTRKNEHFGISIAEAIAAGCIPLVPNSGGQKEIVPLDELRFDSVEEAIEKFKTISNSDKSKYRNYLQNHILQFSEEKFAKNFNDFINRTLIY